MADAETAPLPKITAAEPPPSPAPSAPPRARRSPFAKLGDLPMRFIYRALVGIVGAIAMAAAAVVFFVMGSPDGRTPAAARPLGGSMVTTALPVTPVSPAPSASPGAVASLASSPTPGASVSVSGQVVTPAPIPTPGRSALAVARADPRMPKLPRDRKLANFPGRGVKTKGRLRDRRSGVTFPRFAKAWKLAASAPFATKQVLPLAKGSGHRGLLASCPVPIRVQRKLRDTALVAARWTLNYHPAGSTIRWTASQPIKVGKRKGWVLGYRVQYKVGGKKRMSTTAIALVDIPRGKPALVFITIPDAQKKRRADINTVVSGLRVLKSGG